MPVQPKDEEATILAYATANGIVPMKHSSGLYYQIVDAGTGPAPTNTSKVSVTYTGKLLNGTQFDQKVSPVTFFVNEVIEGWKIGIPLINEGGKIKLIIPSALAYSCNSAGVIPPNAVLFFDISLLDVE